MKTLEQFRQSVEDELGDVYELIRDGEVDRWVNRGRAQLGMRNQRRVIITWADGALSVVFPDGCVNPIRLVSTTGSVPPHTFTDLADGCTMEFLDPSNVIAGQADLYYEEELPEVTSESPSGAPALADEAAISYALSRFFRRVAATRADFRRYVTITGQNGVDVQDLEALSDAHFRDFLDARERLAGTVSATFYSD